MALEELTTESAHRAVGIAVSVTALADVSGLQLYGGLDVPNGLLACLQVQVREEWNTARARCVFHPLGPPWWMKQ